jgi:hypothetical protein
MRQIRSTATKRIRHSRIGLKLQQGSHHRSMFPLNRMVEGRRAVLVLDVDISIGSQQLCCDCNFTNSSS